MTAPMRPQPQPYPQYPPPSPYGLRPQRKSRTGLAILIATGAALLVVIVVVVIGLTAGSGKDTGTGKGAPAKPTAQALRGDVTSDFRSFLAGYLGDGQVGSASAVTRVRASVDNYGLVLDTNLVAQSEVKDTAMTICGYGGAYLLQRGPGTDLSVKVNDSAGNVLVSRRTGGQCEWRR